MGQTTITEALQEIKTIGSRLQKKRGSIGSYIARDARVRDPFEKDGGAEKFITSERQAITDLENRVISIRSAIQRSNLTAQLSVNGTTRTVSEWLTWRREISAGQKDFLGALANGLSSVRKDVQQKGGRILAAAVAVNEASGPNDPPQVVVCIDELKLIAEREAIEQTLGELDGKLSLFNATTVIEV